MRDKERGVIKIKDKKEQKSRKWIVLSVAESSMENILHFANLSEWNVVVVGTSAPDMVPAGVHYLNVTDQERLASVYRLPYHSISQKSIGYLYAIQHGAQWIFDVDGDLEYSKKTSGLGYGCYSRSLSLLKNSTAGFFNPDLFYGKVSRYKHVYPIQNSNDPGQYCLCREMRTPAIQAAVVFDENGLHRVSDMVSATGTSARHNSNFAPPVAVHTGTLAIGSSWRTALFSRNAFFALLLSTSLQSSEDPVLSIFIQRLLHLCGETLGFYGSSATVKRSKGRLRLDERHDVVLQAVEFTTEWKCSSQSLTDCILQLSKEFRERKFSSNNYDMLTQRWVTALRIVGYHFPEVKNTTKDDFYISDDETSRKVKCRPAFVAFEDGNPREEDNKLLALKQDAMQDLEQFCGDSETPKINQPYEGPSALSGLKDKALVITNNFPLNGTSGLLQRLYQPYFGLTVFCGPSHPDSDDKGNDDFPDRLKPFNYIHLSEAEMASGYFAYYCLAKMRDLRLQNVKGYFIMADDTVFNFWNKVDLSISLHPSGLYHFNPAPWFNWWDTDYGEVAARRAVHLFEEKYKNNNKVQEHWTRFGEGFRQLSSSNMSAADALLERYGWAVSDFFYIPSETLDYYSTIMEVFFESSLFHEIAMRKFLGSVPHNTLAPDTYDYLYRKNGRDFWHPHYNDSLIMMHPIKLSQLTSRTIRRQFCDVVVSAFKRNLFPPPV
ncbi:hypothetical protein Q1695_014101 [Nippostrongylus brasiliensis]|nr:hypothetical protein Q1695_014101 [Nippostrongylus brasiliensis]